MKCSVVLQRAGLCLLGALCRASGAQESFGQQQEDGIFPFVADQFLYDPNLFRLPDDFPDLRQVIGPDARRDDYFNRLSIGVAAQWTLARHTVIANAQVDDNRFVHNDALNNRSGSAKLDWGWWLGDQISGHLGANYNRSLAGFANNRFLGKDLLDVREYFASGRYQIGPHLALTGGVRHGETSHSAEPREIDDSHGTTENIGLELQSKAGNVISWDYRHTRGIYAQDVTVNGLDFNRNYNENKTSVRIQYLLASKTTLNASVGYLHREYPDTLAGEFSPSFSGDVWRISLDWQPTAKTQLDIAGWRELKAYVDAESNYFVSRGASISPIWSPRLKLQFSAGASWEHQDYIGSSPILFGLSGRQDKVAAGQFTGTWIPRDWARIDLSYRYEQRESNRTGLSYNDNLGSLSLKFKF